MEVTVLSASMATPQEPVPEQALQPTKTEPDVAEAVKVTEGTGVPGIGKCLSPKRRGGGLMVGV